MNGEFLKMQKIAGLITENQYRQLIENTDNPTHMSKVDWYYIGDANDYPGPKGRVVPKTKGYDDPSQFEDTELYIPVGTEGWIDRDDFMDEEENRVPYKGYEEYFGSVSGEDEEEGGGLRPFENDEGIPLTFSNGQYREDRIVSDRSGTGQGKGLVLAIHVENSVNCD